MKNKRYLPTGQVPLKAWKNVVDAAVAGRAKFLTITPSELKKAVTDELAWFAKVKANAYQQTTALAPLTIAEIKQLADYQRNKCGIKGI